MIRVYRFLQTGLAPMLCVALLGSQTSAKSVPLPSEKAKWIRGRTAHFLLLGDADEKAIAEVGRQMETFRSAIEKIASGVELASPLPTHVYVFRSARSFRPYDGMPEGATGSRIAYFTSNESGNVVAMDVSASHGIERTVYHEYMHYVFRNNFPAMPQWINEGFAELYSTFRQVDAAGEIGRPIENHVQHLRVEPLMPLADLFAITSRSPQYNEKEIQGIFYAESWALTHYLIFGNPETRGKSVDLLRRLRDGASSADAIQATYGIPLPALQSALRDYVRQTRFPYSSLDLGALPSSPSNDAIAFTPMTRAEALCALGNLLVYDDDTLSAADQHFSAATAQDPALAAAWAGRGTVAVRRGKLDAAGGLYAKALELAPADARTLEMAATNLLRKVMGSDGKTFEIPKEIPPDVRKAREYLARSLAIDPDQAESYAAFGMTYLFEPEQARPGIPALERAHRMLPSRPDIAFNLLQLYASAGERERAEALMAGPWTRLADPPVIEASRRTMLNFDLERANDQIAAGDFTAAVETLGSVRERAHDSALAGKIDEQIRLLQTATQRKRQEDEYDRAVAAANGGNLAGAIAILEALLPEVASTELDEPARKTLDSLRAAERARGPKGKPEEGR